MSNIGAILVPLDGSGIAEQALPVGISLARRTGGTLHLVSVVEPLPASVDTEMRQYGVEFERDSHDALSRYLARTTESARRAGVAAVRAEVVTGVAAEALRECAAAHDIGLVVMTTHARRGLSRWWLGSVADRLLRRIAIPVLLLHPGEAPQPTTFRRILVALDGESGDPALEPALALGSLEPDAEYLLLCIAGLAIPLTTPLESAAPHLGRLHVDHYPEAAARKHVQQLAERLGAAGLRVTWRVAPAHDLPGQVLGAARESGADCIAVGNHEAGSLERLLLGNVTGEIVRESALPVLVGPAGNRDPV